jgi:hypothetical protein
MFQAHFWHSSPRASQHVVGISSDLSSSPLTGSCITKMISRTAIQPITGVTRRPHLQQPVTLSASDPTIYPSPLQSETVTINHTYTISLYYTQYHSTTHNITVLHTISLYYTQYHRTTHNITVPHTISQYYTQYHCTTHNITVLHTISPY